VNRCACGKEAHRRTGGEWVCKRCDDIEHSWVDARSNERKYEAGTSPHSISRWACTAFMDVQIGAAAFWSRRGISEPVEMFNAMNGGQS